MRSSLCEAISEVNHDQDIVGDCRPPSLPPPVPHPCPLLPQLLAGLWSVGGGGGGARRPYPRLGPPRRPLATGRGPASPPPTSRQPAGLRPGRRTGLADTGRGRLRPAAGRAQTNAGTVLSSSRAGPQHRRPGALPAAVCRIPAGDPKPDSRQTRPVRLETARPGRTHGLPAAAAGAAKAAGAGGPLFDPKPKLEKRSKSLHLRAVIIEQRLDIFSQSDCGQLLWSDVRDTRAGSARESPEPAGGG